MIAFAGFAAYSISDASVKLIEGRITPYESGFFGALFGIACLPFLLRKGDRYVDMFRTNNWPLWIVRFFASGVGIIGSVTAFTHLSMAEAFCLIFLLPSFVTIMSVVFLKETVGVRRWGAVAIGFLGVLVVLRPGFRELSIGHLGAIFAGMGGALSIVIYRAIGPSEKNISLYGAGLWGGLVICGIAMIPDYATPVGSDWLLLAAYGILGGVGNIFMMFAAARAPAAVIGPIQYSQMLWAIAFGYLIFGDHIDLPMVAGIVLIVGSGLMTIARERVRDVALPPSVGPNAEGALAMVPEDESTEG
nr:DMT family transporter [Rhizobium halophytocola]